MKRAMVMGIVLVSVCAAAFGIVQLFSTGAGGILSATTALGDSGTHTQFVARAVSIYNKGAGSPDVFVLMNCDITTLTNRMVQGTVGPIAGGQYATFDTGGAGVITNFCYGTLSSTSAVTYIAF